MVGKLQGWTADGAEQVIVGKGAVVEGVVSTLEIYKAVGGLAKFTSGSKYRGVINLENKVSGVA